MATFVLVHGAFHGGWCWFKLVPWLEQAGHRVIAPDSPGLGRDLTDLEEVTLDRWTAALIDVIDAQAEPVILVGHSRGGPLISLAAEARPERVEKLAFIAAFLLENGESVADVAKADVDSALGPAMVVNKGSFPTATVREEALREVFYGDCSEEDVALARHLLRPEPLGPHRAPLALSSDRFGKVPKTYIGCAQDRTISPAIQSRMMAKTPCEQVWLDTSHSPFFSNPGGLSAYLLRLVSRS